MLEKEFKFFTDNFNNLFGLYPNKYLVIKDESIKYASDSRDDALSYAAGNFKLGTFLIQPCIKSVKTSHKNITLEAASFSENSTPVHALAVRNNDGISSRIISPVILLDTFTGKKLKTNAIWDTGAENCHISRVIAARLDLVPIQNARSKGLHGSKDVNVYDLKLALSSEPFLVSSLALEYEECIQEDAGFIIGMNVIKLGEFFITTHEGKTLMSFKMPINKTEI